MYPIEVSAILCIIMHNVNGSVKPPECWLDSDSLAFVETEMTTVASVWTERNEAEQNDKMSESSTGHTNTS